MRAMRWSAAVLLVLLLAACGSTPEIDPPAGLTDFTAERYVKKLWTQKLRIRDRKTAVPIVPVVESDVVYMASDRGRMVAFSAARGRERWKTRVQAHVTGGLGSAGELLLLGTSKAEVIAISKRNGKIVWRHRLTSEVLAPPVEAGGVIVARTVDGRLFGISAVSGERLWMYEKSVPSLTLRGLGTPVIVERRVYVGAADGSIVALSLTSGEVVWEKSIATPKGRSELDRLVDVDGDLIVSDGVIYAAAYQGNIVALAAESGRLLWQREMSSYSGLTVDERNIYLADDRSIIRALDRKSGETVWTQDALRMRSVTRPVDHGDFVVTGDYEGYLHWLAKSDGRLIARWRIDESGIHVAPVIADDVLYAAGQGGTITALKLMSPKKPLAPKRTAG